MALPAVKRPVLARLWAVAASLAAPILRRGLRHRATRGKEISARLPERWGDDPTPRPTGRLVWLHAASVGEAVSILPVLTVLAASDVAILLTTGTVTSATVLARRLPALGLGARVMHRFVPLDVPAWAARFLDHWRPDVVGFVESELWPNILAACSARGIPMMLINARMSATSFSYWRRLPSFARSVLGNFARIHARGPEDADRLRALGAGRVHSQGDLKFAAPALPAEPGALAGLQRMLGTRPVWVAASTHPGEETAIAAAHALIAADYPGLLTIIAPRHPDRGPDLAAALDAPRRGADQPPPEHAGIWIADTIGELGLWYRLARVALVGRSLLPPGGGQNPLEPARLRCPVITGPHMGNFTDPMAHLRAVDAVIEVADAASLANAVCRLLADDAARAARAERGFAAVQLYATLPTLTAEALLGLIPGGR